MIFPSSNIERDNTEYGHRGFFDVITILNIYTQIIRWIHTHPWGIYKFFAFQMIQNNTSGFTRTSNFATKQEEDLCILNAKTHLNSNVGIGQKLRWKIKRQRAATSFKYCSVWIYRSIQVRGGSLLKGLMLATPL